MGGSACGYAARFYKSEGGPPQPWDAIVAFMPVGRQHRFMAFLRNAIVAFAVLLFCPAGASAQTKLSEPQLHRLRTAMPGMTDECAAKVKAGGLDAFPLRVDRCFKMMAKQRWRGLWWQGFEHSRFCPAPARSCGDNSAGEHIWLDFNEGIEPAKTTAVGGLFSIDFVGRKTAMHGSYGHLGGSSQEITVDKLIALKRLRTDRWPSPDRKRP